MIVGLENLKEEIKKKQFYDLAMTIVKYQKFRTSAIIDKLNFDASEATKINYFNLGILYLKEKVRRRNMPSRLYDCIDDILAKHVQPLTPSVDDERNSYKRNYTKKTAVPPVARLDIVNKPLTEKYDMYGIKLPNGHVVVCKSEDFADGYLVALKDCNVNATDYKKILLKMSEI